MAERYQRGKIYKIVSPNTNKVYVGSTTEPLLSRRMAGHTRDMKRWKNGSTNYTSSFEILEAGEAQIVLLELCPCNSKDELFARENHWMNELKNICVNRNKAPLGLTIQEWNSHYYQENKDDIKFNQKQYYNDNKEGILAKRKQYQLDNKEKIRARKRLHYIAQERHECPCGGRYTTNKKSTHSKSQKHQKWLATQPDI